MKQREKQLIGRREFIEFPDFGLSHIEAKVDTGAYTLALHCDDIQVKNDTLYFKPLGKGFTYYKGAEQSTKEFSKKTVKNSFGSVEERYIIKTRIKIGNRIIKSLISLTDRANMRYPVLIGRRLLKNKFIIDVSQLHLTSK